MYRLDFPARRVFRYAGMDVIGFRQTMVYIQVLKIFVYIYMAKDRGKGPLMTAILLHCPSLGVQGTFLVSLTNNSPKLGDKPLLKPVNVEIYISTKNKGWRVPK
jgi:hypothetical protein